MSGSPVRAAPPRWWLTAGLGLPVVAAAACCAGIAGGALGLLKLFGENRLGEVALLAVVSAIVASGHAAVSWWTVRARPRWWDVALTQAPFLVTYVAAMVWYSGSRFPLPYFVWLAAGLSAVGWLTVWYLRDFRRGRRVVVYLAALALLVVVNQVGIFAVSWRQTNAFGLRGEPSPLTAFRNLAATSCLSDNDYRTTSGRTFRSDCPQGPGADPYAGQYDQNAFGDLLCGDQPHGVFTQWHDRRQQYRYFITLEFAIQDVEVDGSRIDPPYPIETAGKVAIVTAEMRMRASSTREPVLKRFTVDKSTETWRVRLETVPLGGWKVCRIDIDDPIHLTEVG